MSIPLINLLKLKNLRRFDVIAGKSGLEKEVGSVCLADFELDNNLIPYADGFRRGSFVIASMRDNEILRNVKMLDIVKSLDEINCIGLAYNSKMIYKPGKNVIDYCNKVGFPLLAFDPKEVYIENAIFEIMQAITKSGISFSIDRDIKYMLDGVMSPSDVENFARSINPLFGRNCTVSYIWTDPSNTSFSPVKIAKSYSDRTNNDGIVSSLVPYRDGVIAIISMGIMDYAKRDETLDYILDFIGNRPSLKVASSMEHQSYGEMDQAIRECAECYITACIEKKNFLRYEDIGLYKLILPNRNDPKTLDFVNRYLSVMNREQLDTAISYVMCGGDYDKVSEDIICHRNTVRYRMNKIHEMTDPDASEFRFLENLSIAIKLHLANKVR